jgi:hypothetical protein
MAERNLSLRLSVVDGGKVKAELSEIGVGITALFELSHPGIGLIGGHPRICRSGVPAAKSGGNAGQPTGQQAAMQTFAAGTPLLQGRCPFFGA